jgi:uncharacterized protein (TIGR00255 family)
VVEVRSVNGRYADVNLRLPPGGWSLEPLVRKRIQDRCRRGRIDVQVRWEPLSREEEPIFELQLGKARAFHRGLQTLKSDLGLPGEVDLALMSTFRELLGVKEASLEEEREALEEALDGALEALQSMRRTEGEALQTDLAARIGWMREQVEQVKVRIPQMVQAHLGKWRERLETLLGDSSLDAGRLEQEGALWVDRLDVTEETVRLASHLDQFLGVLEQGPGAGKKLDFLLQEMHREVNTVGAKAMDVDVAHRVVEMKAQLERMREQVQNVE